MTNFFDALKLVKEPVQKKLEYRLYYGPDGTPLFYTMADEPGDYITVTKAEFAECRYDVVIKNKKMHKIQGAAIGKLAPSETGYGTALTDMSLVGDEKYWSVKTYE